MRTKFIVAAATIGYGSDDVFIIMVYRRIHFLVDNNQLPFLDVHVKKTEDGRLEYILDKRHKHQPIDFKNGKQLVNITNYKVRVIREAIEIEENPET